MQIVIEIDSELFDAIHDGYIEPNDHFYVMDAVREGTPLPEHHGNLKDEMDIIKSLFDYHKGTKTLGQCVEDAPTIIPATKEGAE